MEFQRADATPRTGISAIKIKDFGFKLFNSTGGGANKDGQNQLDASICRQTASLKKRILRNCLLCWKYR